MAGKPPVFASRPLAYAMDSLSKNTLIDILVDRARLECEPSVDAASDRDIACVLQGWIAPVQAVRNDKPINLPDRLEKMIPAAAKDEEAILRFQQTPTGRR